MEDLFIKDKTLYFMIASYNYTNPPIYNKTVHYKIVSSQYENPPQETLKTPEDYKKFLQDAKNTLKDVPNAQIKFALHQYYFLASEYNKNTNENKKEEIKNLENFLKVFTETFPEFRIPENTLPENREIFRPQTEVTLETLKYWENCPEWSDLYFKSKRWMDFTIYGIENDWLGVNIGILDYEKNSSLNHLINSHFSEYPNLKKYLSETLLEENSNHNHGTHNPRSDFKNKKNLLLSKTTEEFSKKMDATEEKFKRECQIYKNIGTPEGLAEEKIRNIQENPDSENKQQKIQKVLEDLLEYSLQTKTPLSRTGIKLIQDYFDPSSESNTKKQKSFSGLNEAFSEDPLLTKQLWDSIQKTDNPTDYEFYKSLQKTHMALKRFEDNFKDYPIETLINHLKKYPIQEEKNDFAETVRTFLYSENSSVSLTPDQIITLFFRDGEKDQNFQKDSFEYYHHDRQTLFLEKIELMKKNLPQIDIHIPSIYSFIQNQRKPKTNYNSLIQKYGTSFLPEKYLSREQETTNPLERIKCLYQFIENSLREKRVHTDIKNDNSFQAEKENPAKYYSNGELLSAKDVKNLRNILQSILLKEHSNREDAVQEAKKFLQKKPIEINFRSKTIIISKQETKTGEQTKQKHAEK